MVEHGWGDDWSVPAINKFHIHDFMIILLQQRPLLQSAPARSPAVGQIRQSARKIPLLKNHHSWRTAARYPPLSKAQMRGPRNGNNFMAVERTNPSPFLPPSQSSLLLLIELTAHPFPLPPSFTRNSKRALWTEVHFSFTSKLFVGGEKGPPTQDCYQVPETNDASG